MVDQLYNDVVVSLYALLPHCTDKHKKVVPRVTLFTNEIICRFPIQVYILIKIIAPRVMMPKLRIL